jgi:nucleoside phosphorylase
MALNFKRLFLVMVLLAVILGGLCVSLYEENYWLRLELSHSITADPTSRIGIAIALPSEAQVVLGFFSETGELVAYGYRFLEGEIASKPVVIVISGVGEEAAAGAVFAMNSLFNITWAVSIGTAGAHSSILELGDVIVGARIISFGSRMYTSSTSWSYLNNGITFPNSTRMKFRYLNSTTSLVELAAKASKQVSLPLVPGNLTSNGQPHQPIIFLNGTIASSNFWTANSSLITQTRMALGTDAEEEEAYGFGLSCYRLGIPFVKIAVISDSDLTGLKFTPATIRTGMTNGAMLLQEMIMLSE